MSAVLRVRGNNPDVAQSLGGIPADKIEALWEVGDMGPLGRECKNSGCNILLSNAADGRELTREAFSAFAELAPKVADMVRSGASVEMHLTLYVSGGHARSLRLEPELLRSLEHHDVPLVISAYPLADDDNDDDDDGDEA